MKVQTRQSMHQFTAASQSNSERNAKTMRSRSSTSSLDSIDSDKASMEMLLEIMMGDPKKKEMVQRLLREDRHKIEEYKRKERKKSVAENKRTRRLKQLLRCESPTALFRRRALQKLGNEEDQLLSPSERLLSDVVAYIEINSQGKDCSDGAKVLMETMGATVKDKLTPEITHVIFKDGSYETLNTARLLNIHLVSVLWLDAVKRNKVRVPEKDYPVIGMECEKATQIFQDYEKVINEEYHRNKEDTVRNNEKKNKIAISPERKNRNRRITNIIPSSQVCEVESIISLESGHLSCKRILDDDNISSSHNSSFTSDRDDSDCGIINGYLIKSNSQISDIDVLSLSSHDNIENQVIDTSVIDTSSSKSMSLLKGVTIKKTNYYDHINVDMDLTDKVNCLTNKENTLNEKKITIDNKKNFNKPDTVLKLIQDNVLNGISKDDKLFRKAYVNLFTRNNCTKSLNSKEQEIQNTNKNNEERNDIFLSNECGSDDRNKITLNTEDYFSLRVSNESSKASSDSKNIDSAVINLKHLDQISNVECNDKNKINSNDVNTNKLKLTQEKSDTINQCDGRDNVSTRNLRSSTRSKDDSYLPNKKNVVINVKVTKSEKKPKAFRKLYNVNSSYDEELFKNWNTNNVDAAAVAIPKVTVIGKHVIKIPTPIKSTLLLASSSKHILDTKTKTTNTKKNKKTNRKRVKTPIKVLKPGQLDNSKDEQTELIDEFVNKKRGTSTKKPNKEKLKKPMNRRLFSPLKSPTNKRKEDVSVLNRRSSLDFIQCNPIKKRLRMVHKIKNPSIVCTRMHKSEVETFTQIVQKLGYFHIEDEVSQNTTHLIVGEPMRTINLLRAIARGCWILKKEWLFRSLEASKWISEEDYELTGFSPAVQQCRMQRQAFGPLYSMDIFSNCGPIYISHNTNPRHSDLQELIELCKGVITDVSGNATVVVGDWVRHAGCTCVTEKWVLDSITFNKRKSYKKYILKQQD